MVINVNNNNDSIKIASIVASIGASADEKSINIGSSNKSNMTIKNSISVLIVSQVVSIGATIVSKVVSKEQQS